MKKQIKLVLPAGRKLSLNKKTISNLSSSEMGKKMGGAGPTINGNSCPGHKTCYSCYAFSCARAC